jgi:FAD/FMN-containing dehydrogenase
MHEIRCQPVEPVDFNTVRRVEGFQNIKAEFPAYLPDESKFSCQPFDHLFFPRSEAELSTVIREMARRDVKVTIAGARTGLVGGCVPNQGALVSLENFDRVLALYYDAPAAEWRLKAQCAVNLRTIAAQLAVKSIPDIERCADGMTLIEMDRFRQDPGFYFYPPDPTEMSASLGGTVATNASGARTFRYGPTRDWVRGHPRHAGQWRVAGPASRKVFCIARRRIHRDRFRRERLQGKNPRLQLAADQEHRRLFHRPAHGSGRSLHRLGGRLRRHHRGHGRPS